MIRIALTQLIEVDRKTYTDIMYIQYNIRVRYNWKLHIIHV